MNENKTGIIGSFVTWLLTLWTWYEQHTAAVVGLFAIAASCITTISVVVSNQRRKRRAAKDDEPSTTI